MYIQYMNTLHKVNLHVTAPVQFSKTVRCAETLRNIDAGETVLFDAAVLMCFCIESKTYIEWSKSFPSGENDDIVRNMSWIKERMGK